jgi:hypothetical protein
MTTQANNVAIESSQINSSGVLQVAGGGTGAATLTSNAVLVGNGTSAVQTVAPGASGNVLTSNGTNWASVAPSGGGGTWTLISTQTISSATASVQWTGLSGYNNYYLIYDNVTASNDICVLCMQVGTGATPTYLTSGYYYSVIQNTGTSSTVNAFIPSFGDPGSSAFTLAGLIGVATTLPGASGFCNLGNINGGYFSCNGISASVNWDGSDSVGNGILSGGLTSANTVTAIKLLMMTGATNNITGGTFSLYGISS